MFLHRRLVAPYISIIILIYRAALKKAFDILETKNGNGIEFVDFAAFVQLFEPKIRKTQLSQYVFNRIFVRSQQLIMK